MPASSPPWAPYATSHPDARTWVAHPNRRLAVYRDGRLLWHSHSTGGTDEVAVGHGHVAFTSFRPSTGMTLWIAPLGGRERMIARNEELLGWTRAGLVTEHGNELRLRAPDGRILRDLGRARAAFRDAGRILILRPRGVIVRTNGLRETVFADLRPLGMTRQPWLQPLPRGLIEVSAGNKVVFLDRQGRLFASTTFARATRPGGGGAIVGEPLPLPDGTAVLFALNRRRGGSDPGVETVYRLDRGHRVPRPLFSTRLGRLACAQWAVLEFRRGRVLFAGSEGQTAILDPAGRARPIDLTRLVRRLFPARPSPDQTLDASWR